MDDRVVVIQIGTKGMDVLKPWLLEQLQQKLYPSTIYEKSFLPSRREEGLKDKQGLLQGLAVGEVKILENNLSFYVDFEKGQKTGFFLDHREMRQWVRQLAKGKRVLNAFAYTGGLCDCEKSENYRSRPYFSAWTSTC